MAADVHFVATSGGAAKQDFSNSTMSFLTPTRRECWRVAWFQRE
jgi:hypothetical protein